MKKARCNTAILISGGGTNLQSFINYVARDDDSNLDLSVVLSNRPDAYGLVRAKDAGIPTVCIEHGKFADRESFDEAIAESLADWKPDLLILAGFMRILSAAFVRRYEGRILNIHPALLPAYPGLNTHQRVLDAGDAWHGSTVHFVTEELDGGPAILQGRIRVDANETAGQLAARVQTIEHQIYPSAANLFATGRLTYRNNMAYLDKEPLNSPIQQDFPG